MNLREEVESLSSAGPWTPPADWLEDDTHLTLLLDLPGVNAERVELHEEGDTVTVAGERAAPAGRLSSERPTGTFSRTLTFPQEVLPQTAQASLTSGVLTVKFQKKHPTINVSAVSNTTASTQNEQ